MDYTGRCRISCGVNGMKLGIVIYSNDPETVWNAFRIGVFARKQGDTVSVFLLGKGVEAEQVSNDKFNIKEQMEKFVSSKGEILSCGTCFKIRNSSGTELCPLSTMNDLYEMVKEADKVITF